MMQVDPNETLRVRNWGKWQTYRRDRGQPPWIKVHRMLLRDPNWVALTDAQRGQLVSIWVLAADRDGVIPASPLLLRKLLYLDNEPDVQTLMRLGFLEPDVTVASSGRQGDAPEAEAEAEAEERTPREAVSVDDELDVGFESDGSDLPHAIHRMSAAELIHAWGGSLPERPTEAERRTQKMAARRLTKEHTREELVQAMVGMTALFPHCPPPNGKNEPWDLGDLERKFSKAKAKALDHPELKSRRAEAAFLGGAA